MSFQLLAEKDDWKTPEGLDSVSTYPCLIKALLEKFAALIVALISWK